MRDHEPFATPRRTGCGGAAEVGGAQADQTIIQAFARLDPVALGVAVGVVLGVVILLATMWIIVKGGPVVGPRLALLGQYMIGYTVTVGGAWIGLGYGFVIGFVVGCAIAFTRNGALAIYLAAIRRRAELEAVNRFLDEI